MNHIRTMPEKSFIPSNDTLRDYRYALGQFPTGVAVVTTMAKGNDPSPMGITINSFTSVSAEPPLVMWCINKSSRRYKDFIQAKDFSIHILPETAQELCFAFAKSEKAFHQTSWHLNHQNTPVLDNCLARFDCTEHALYDGGDHTILLGFVHKVSVFEGIPLLFSQGKFQSTPSGINSG